jgi:translation initiation factor IF-3
VVIFTNKMQQYFVNERIRATNLMVIHDGNNLGVLSKDEALKIAKEHELDLVLIAPQATPPVAKILDFSKFLYDERKKTSAAKAKSKKSEVKELRLSPNIGDGDLQKRAERAKEFISDGNKVKITVVLKGREAAYPHIAMEKVDKFTKELEDTARLENEVKRMGNMIVAVYTGK